MPEVEQPLIALCGRTGHAGDFLALAQALEHQGELRGAATAYDRAYGLAPNDSAIANPRRDLLDRLAVVEHGIKFRFIPAGTFLMGSETGDPDETPVHPVKLCEYWLSEAPLSWSEFCELMGWLPPPLGRPNDWRESYRGDPDSVFEIYNSHGREPMFLLCQANKIRLQYCEDATTRALWWVSHAPAFACTRHKQNDVVSSRDAYGTPPRDDPDRPWRYDEKPMVSVAWQEAEELCRRITTKSVSYRLPSEAQWEKAARGGLIDCPYPWGNDQPGKDRCDFNRFDEFSILPMRKFAPNGYGLYAMSGSVWEWTADWYSADYYDESPAEMPEGPKDGVAKVLRGGSWADCAEAVTVSFRMPRESQSWTEKAARLRTPFGHHHAPNIGFRLCRTEVAASSPGQQR